MWKPVNISQHACWLEPSREIVLKNLISQMWAWARCAVWIVALNFTLIFRNLTCGKCTRSAAGSSSQRGTASGSSTRTSSTDGASEQPSLPFFTIKRLFILLCSYPQPKLIPSAFAFVLLLFYNLFHFWKWKKFERRKFCFFPLNLYDISDFFFLTAWGMNVDVRERHHTFFSLRFA